MSEKAGRDRMYTKEDLDKGVPVPAPILPLLSAIKNGSLKGAKVRDDRPTRKEHEDLMSQLEKEKVKTKKLKERIRKLEDSQQKK